MSMNVIDLDEQRKQKEQANKPKVNLDDIYSKLEWLEEQCRDIRDKLEEVLNE